MKPDLRNTADTDPVGYTDALLERATKFYCVLDDHAHWEGVPARKWQTFVLLSKVLLGLMDEIEDDLKASAERPREVYHAPRPL